MPNIPVMWRASQMVNVVTAGDQTRPRITQLTNGNLLVLWATAEPQGTAFIARLFDPAGNPIGGELFRQYLTPEDNFTFPDVVAASNGRFVTSYMDGNNASIYLNTWDASGAPVSGSPPVEDSRAAALPDFANPTMAWSSANRVLTVFEQLSPSGSTIIGRISTPGSSTLGARPTLFDFAGGVVDPAVASLTFNGNFVIAATHLQAGDSRIVYRIVTSAGADVAGPFEITGTGSNGRSDSQASVSSLAGGGFVIAWQSSNGTDSNIEYRVFTSAGSQSAAGSIGAGPNDNLRDPTVIPLADGSFILAYDDDLNLAQQAAHISSAGALLGTFAYGGDGGDGDAIGLADGRFATVWIDATGEIRLGMLDTRDSPNMRVGVSVVAGTIGDDVITADYGRTFAGAGNDLIHLDLDYDDYPSADGGEGIDTVDLGNPNNYIQVDLAAGTVETQYISGSYVFYITQSATNFENVRYSGAGDLAVRGTNGDNVIVAGSGWDGLEGFGGNDSFYFGAAFTANDGVDGGQGTNDQIFLQGNYTGGNAVILGMYTIANVEAIVVLPGFSYDLTTNDGNVAAGGVLKVDATQLAAGQSLTFEGSAETNGSFLITGGAGNDTFSGGAGNDNLTGEAGSDILNGGTGADAMAGGPGDDLYVVDNSGDVVIENAGAGNDRVLALASYALSAGAEIELLAARNQSGTSALNLTGNDLAGTIIGNDGVNNFDGRGGSDVIFALGGNDILDGGAGSDYLAGGTGDDIYVIDSDRDVVVESAGQGSDRVLALVSYRLAAGAEVELISAANQAGAGALDLTGNDLNSTMIGNEGANTIDGRGGNDVIFALGGADVIDGGTGNDYLAGGAGNDTYVVDSFGDVIVENAGEGSDRVLALASYRLAAGVEVELLSAQNQAGTSAFDLTGNDLNGTLIGNDGANSLNGRGGNDTIYGLGGADIIDGGAGNDYVIGGLGGDTYVVDTLGDIVVENVGEGSDRVLALASYTLTAGAEVELLSAQNQGGTTALNLTGNDFASTMIGNDGVNTLDGRGGNDTIYGLGGADIIDGGTGNDYLLGGAGADTFRFSTALGGNVDTIADFLAVDDTIALDDSVFTALGLGALNANAFVIGTAAQDADDRIIYNSATGALFYDADGNGAGAAVQFATLSGNPAISASDFIMV